MEKDTTELSKKIGNSSEDQIEYYEQWGLKYKFVILPPEAKPAHHFHKPTFWSWWQCKRCNFKTQKVSDLRKNNGCNAFSNYDTEKDHRFDFEDLKYKRRYLTIEEEPIRGCNIESRSEWVQYPETGKAIQEDKFINEQVIKAVKEYARI